MDLIARMKSGDATLEKEFENNFTKPWGAYLTFVRNENATVKLLSVDNELSVQSHKNRDEIWFLIKGSAEMYRGAIYPSHEETVARLNMKVALPGDAFYIPRGMVHTAVNLGSAPAEFIEVATGIATEEDIERYYDMHGRVELGGYKGIPLKELIPILREKYK